LDPVIGREELKEPLEIFAKPVREGGGTLEGGFPKGVEHAPHKEAGRWGAFSSMKEAAQEHL
jgi:hypothetical protein